jgi:hypothetical protein
LLGNILKDDGAGFYKAAGGDGAVEAIELGLLRTGIGHPTLSLWQPALWPRLRKRS